MALHKKLKSHTRQWVDTLSSDLHGQLRLLINPINVSWWDSYGLASEGRLESMNHSLT
jgi:hypothetical protein